jgi:demethylmenaquinone methyltransferase/2-methoxy-6-polyprenyl-1,4-benzoquinol methylase
MKPAQLTGRARADYVQSMFARIAGRYDLMNRLMTAGQDGRWRREVIRHAVVPPGGCLLDLGTGTGDLAVEARRQGDGVFPVGADFTLPMMRAGQARLSSHGAPALDWCGADALRLPFPTASFDAVVSGFLMRNVGDLDQALVEQRRVLKTGGRVVILDTSRPPDSPLLPLIRFHLNVVIPTLGGLLTGSREAYTYLPDSTQTFLSAPELADRIAKNGFQKIGFQSRMFGTIAIHWGVK